MRFRTEIDIKPFPWEITRNDGILFIGSCFSENISARLARLKFSAYSNPCGISYNPVSIAETIDFVIKKRRFHHIDLFLHNGLYHSIKHHSSFSGTSPDKVTDKINAEINRANNHLKTAKCIFITLGTAFLYKTLDTGAVAANCHKLPAGMFTHELIKHDEIYSTLLKSADQLKEFNPGIEIIFTVSPVRHWKNGAVENQRSKSYLITSIHEVIEKTGFCWYFPSYEIMMDDLRDYRFYEEDFLHPSKGAVDYIFEKFSDAFFSRKTKEVNSEIESIRRMIDHKPFFPGTDEHEKFIQNLKIRMEKLHEKEGSIDFTEEFEAIRKTNSHLD